MGTLISRLAAKGSRICPVLGALLLVSIAVSPTAGNAQPIIDFDIGNLNTGSIKYLGGDNPLIGSGIGVDTVHGIDTPSNDGTIGTCVSCTLVFMSGNYTGGGSANWQFGSGLPASITLTGGLDFDNNGVIDSSDIPIGTILLTGQIVTAEVVPLGSTSFKVSLLSFLDTKDQALKKFFGLGDFVDWMGGLNLSFYAGATPPDAFSSSVVLSGDVTNSPVPVPEPASLFLLGSGLIGLGLWGQRRLVKKG